MSDEIKKIDLSEAYSLVRSMSNAFKAFKNAEEVIESVMQGRDELVRVTESIRLLKVEEQGSIAAADAANVKRDEAVAAQKLEEEGLMAAKERISNTVTYEAKRAKDSVTTAKNDADMAIARIKSGIDKASSDALAYRAESTSIIAGVDAEIAAKSESLAALQAEIDALKKKVA